MATGKKRKIRKMRKTAYTEPSGKTASHKMVWTGDTKKKRKGDHGVFPSVRPKKGKETSTKAEDWESQSWQEAVAGGEYIPTKSRKRAEKLAAGAWKKGKDRKEAMKAYKKSKKKK
ncbi:MAG: hypothetical protein ACTSQF_00075 [Candidatus Heimdallarchaeaceae archaeon]